MHVHASVARKSALGAACAVAALGLAAWGLAGAPGMGLAAGTPDFAWTAESDCAGCHEAEVGSFVGDEASSETRAQDTADAARTAGDEAAPCLATVHAALVENCAVCHDDEAGLAKAHAKVKGDGTDKQPKKLRRTAVDPQVCLACHGDLADIAKATEGLAVLTDKDGTTVNPHSLPKTAEHDSLTCGTCHKLHGEGSLLTEAMGKTAADTCLSCHHAGVYACGTCH